MTITRDRPAAPIQRPGEIGTNTERIDGIPKVKGEFAYSSDLCVEGMLCGATLRSPHPRARHLGDRHRPRRSRCPASTPCSPTRTCPAARRTGWRSPTSRCSRGRTVRYQGEPIALVAADHPETARRAADAIEVDYEVLEPVTDPERAIEPRRAAAAPRPATCCATSSSTTATRTRPADVVVDGRVRGRHAGPGVPRARVGPRGAGRRRRRRPATSRRSGCTSTATRSPRSLDLPPEKVRLTLAGVGGAFGGREDLVDAGPRVPARAPHRPPGEDGLRPRGVVLRARPPPPGRMRYEHGATTRRAPRLRPRADRARRRRLRVELDRRVRQRRVASRSAPTTCPTRASTRTSPTRTTRRAARCAASARCRSASRHEAQMDRLAAALDMDPVELRIRNAMAPGCRMPTGQLDPRAGAGRRAARAPARDAAAAARHVRRPARAARRRLQHHARRGRPARRRLRGRASRTSASRRASTTTRPRACGCRWTAASRWSRSTRRPPRSARACHRAGADRAHRARRRARRGARRRHARRARPARARPRGRPT